MRKQNRFSCRRGQSRHARMTQQGGTSCETLGQNQGRRGWERAEENAGVAMKADRMNDIVSANIEVTLTVHGWDGVCVDMAIGLKGRA